MSEEQHKRVIISGGGTGGHVFPAIAIAHALKEADPGVELLFVGAKGKMEMEKVPESGFRIEGLWISGLQRRLTLRNLLFPLKLLVSLFKCFRILRRFRPDAAVGVGGYASGPLCFMAAKRRLPVIIQEQNSFPGITNKVLAKYASVICVAYDNMDRFFPGHKIALTGNPVRRELLADLPDKQEALQSFGLAEGAPVILSLGGSLGSLTINESIAGGLQMVVRKGYRIIWQTGQKYYEKYSHLSEQYGGGVMIMPFITAMDQAYAAADVIISRAGAIAISELSLVGKPVVLIPSPNVAEDHQTKNAKALEQIGAAMMIRDGEARTKLIPEVTELLGDPARQRSMGESIKARGMPHAAEKIADEILNRINRS